MPILYQDTVFKYTLDGKGKTERVEWKNLKDYLESSIITMTTRVTFKIKDSFLN